MFARIHAGPVFALARIQENTFEEAFPEYFAKCLGEVIRCEYMLRLYSHPREDRKKSLANYLCIGFVPGGIPLGRTPRESCNCTLLRRVLRRFFKGSAFLEGFFEGALYGFR